MERSSLSQFPVLLNPKQEKGIFLFSLFGFIALTIIAVALPPTVADRWFSLEVQKHGSIFLDAFMKGVSSIGYIGYSIPLVLCTAILFLLAKKKKEALFTLLTLASGLVSSVVKYLVNGPRPSKDLVRVIELTRQQSFPSGHVLFYTVFFGFMCFLMYRLKQFPMTLRLLVSTVSLLLILLISLSRVYLGAHWLSDVIAGYLLGIMCLHGLIRLFLSDLRL